MGRASVGSGGGRSRTTYGSDEVIVELEGLREDSIRGSDRPSRAGLSTGLNQLTTLESRRESEINDPHLGISQIFDPFKMSADPDVLKVYVLPVSGGWFPMQLMLLGQVYQARLLNAGGRFKSTQDYTPDICCAASGGNIATYIAMAGDWSDTGIRRVSSNIHSEMFCRNWWPGYMTFLPTWVLGIFAGALFRTGYGANMLLDKIFTPSTIQKTEIWTGTFNQSTRTCELFCNKKPGETYVWPLTYNRFLYRSMPLNFLRGNMSEIGKAIMASASIPFIFNSQTIGHHEYADGGIMYASPLTPLQDEICRIVTGVTTPPHEVMLAPPIQSFESNRGPWVAEVLGPKSSSNVPPPIFRLRSLMRLTSRLRVYLEL